MKTKTYIIGWNADTDKLQVFKTESEASRVCNHWSAIEAETAEAAKDEYRDKYTQKLEE